MLPIRNILTHRTIHGLIQMAIAGYFVYDNYSTLDMYRNGGFLYLIMTPEWILKANGIIGLVTFGLGFITAIKKLNFYVVYIVIILMYIADFLMNFFSY